MATMSSDSAADTRVFEELLDAEVFLNPVKLQECARQGVPQLYRSVVYRFLLGVSSTDKSTELTTERMQEEDFADLERAFLESQKKAKTKQHSTYSPLFFAGSAAPSSVRASVLSTSTQISQQHYCSQWDLSRYRKRFHQQHCDNLPRRKRFDRIMRVFQMAHQHQQLNPCEIDWIIIVAVVFESLYPTAHDTYYCVEQLLDVMVIDGSEGARLQLHGKCGLFLCLFRSLNEDLYLHFFAEELHYNAWLPEMMATLLAANIALEDCLRLWDTYLADIAESCSAPLHMFVILAILEEFTEVLVELDRAGILSFLRKIPRINVEHVLHKASGMRSEALSRELI